MNVSGLTTTSAHRQSKNRASETIAKRIAGVVLRLFAFRSWNSASCLRRNRFSAMRAVRDDKNKRIKVNNFRFYNRLQVSFRKPAARIVFFADHRIAAKNRWRRIVENDSGQSARIFRSGQVVRTV